MTRNEHDEAQGLIALGGDISDEQQAWLRAHQQGCGACRDFEEAAGRVVRAMRSQPLAADSALVQMTQMRVRARAVEMRQQRERLWVICVCCAAVTMGTAFTTALMWRGFAWIGHQAGLPESVWQIGLLV